MVLHASPTKEQGDPLVTTHEGNTFNQSGARKGSLRHREVNVRHEEDESNGSSSTAGSTDAAAAKGRVPPSRQGTGASSVGKRPGLKRMLTDMMQPERKVGKEPTYWQSLRAIVTCTWLNILLVCVPISFAIHFSHVGDLANFLVAFFAIIPLAKLLGFATEEIAIRVGPTLGGLLNATLGNAVELIVAILALVKCELEVVQSSLLGSILSNLLLVLGCCFLAGGIRYSEVGFSNSSVQANSSLLVISIAAILMPAGFHASFGDALNEDVERSDILKMSRGIAVILLLIYIAYLVFQLFTHAHLYDEHGNQLPPEDGMKGIGSHRIFKPAKSAGGSKAARARAMKLHDQEMSDKRDEAEDDEVEEPSINLVSCIVLLIVVTVLVGFVAEWLVDGISGVTCGCCSYGDAVGMPNCLDSAGGTISTQWVGLILLPIAGNAAEHVTAVTVAYKDKLDLSIGVAVGSSIQIALFVIPVLVLLGWCLDKPLSLLFDPFQTVALFLSVLVVNYTVADNRANWLEGFILAMVYVIVAVSFFFYVSSILFMHHGDNKQLGLSPIQPCKSLSARATLECDH